MPSELEDRVTRLETQMRGVLDHLDTIVWFRDTLKATQEGLAVLRSQVEEMDMRVINGFNGTATRVELAATRAEVTATREDVGGLRAEMREGFDAVLARLPKDGS